MTTTPLTVAAITLDFGNTLVRVDRPGLRFVVEDTAAGLIRRDIVVDRPGFLAAWSEERDRQFREEVPRFRETDMRVRAVRVLARVRGMSPPAPDGHWNDAAAAELVEQDEIEAVLDVYSAAFLSRMTPVADASATLEQLADRGFALAILSNWPLASTIDRFAEAQGWTPFLRAIVVSQRVGVIKPHPDIFRAAEAELGLIPAAANSPVGALAPVAHSRTAILHVGDDWAADVVGASQAGWRTAYLRGRQDDTPLPTSTRGDGPADAGEVEPDVEIDELSELDALVELGGT